MRMLKHIQTGRVYVFNAQLARAEGMEEFHDPDFGKPAEAVQEAQQAPPVEQGENEERGGGNQIDPLASKSLDEMTRDELLTVAEKESEIRGDGMALSRMKKADLIAYITGQQTGEGA